LVATAWTEKFDSFVPNEDIRVIGMAGGSCMASESQIEFRASKGVSAPSTDLEYDDCYFHVAGCSPAGGAGSGGGVSMESVFLPDGFYFEVDEDEPIFFDMYARAIGDGGTVHLYYVNKRDWKK